MLGSRRTDDGPVSAKHGTANLLSIEELRSRFPLGGTVEAAYKLTFRNWQAFFKLAWKWLLLAIIPLNIAFMLYAIPVLREMQDAMVKSPMTIPVEITSKLGLAGTALSLAMSLPMASIAVGWHRLILRQAQPGSADTLRLDATVWRYLGIGLLFSLAIFLPSVLQMLLMGDGTNVQLFSWSSQRPIWLSLALLLVIAAFVARLSVTLPGVALDLPEATIAGTWQRTRRHTFKLFAGAALALVPVAVLAALFNAIANAVGTDAALFSGHLLTSLARLIGVAVMLTFLSLAFRHFYKDAFPPST